MSRSARIPLLQWRFGEKGTIVLAILLSALPPLCTDLYMPALPLIVEDLGTTEAMGSSTIMVFFIFMATGMLIGGPCSDKFGRRPALLVSGFVALLSSVACVFSPTIIFMMVCRSFVGLASGSLMSLGTAVIKDLFSGKKLGTAISLTQAVAMIAPIAAPLIGAIILEIGDWRTEFIALAVFMALLLVGIFFQGESLAVEKRSKSGVLHSFKGLGLYMRDSHFIRLVLIAAFMAAPYMAYIGIASFVYITFYGVSTTAFGALFAGASAIAILGPVVCMKMVGIKLSTRMLTILLPALVSAIALPLLGHLGPISFLISFAPFMFAASYSRPLIMSAVLQRVTVNVGAASSVSNFLTNLLGSMGMIAANAPWPDLIFGLSVITFVCTIASIIIWLTCFRALKNQRP